MATYDPSVIHLHASRLYDRARGLVVSYGLGLGVLGLILGGFAGTIGYAKLSGMETVLGGLLFAFIGVAIGRSRGFELRLQAQVALCQVQIEQNTRQHGMFTQVQPPPSQAPGVSGAG